MAKSGTLPHYLYTRKISEVAETTEPFTYQSTKQIVVISKDNDEVTKSAFHVNQSRADSSEGEKMH